MLNKYFLLLPTVKTVLLSYFWENCDTFNFFEDSLQEQIWFEIEIFCNIINVFTL